MMLLFILAALVQIAFLFRIRHGLRRIQVNDHEQKSNDLPPISVIIAARNECENLRKHLRDVLNQAYPDFEVIVVNDRSTDASHDALLELQTEFERLRIHTIPTIDSNGEHGKKHALAEGIAMATNEHLVFTDADCKPDSDRWLEEFGRAFRRSADVVVGSGAFNAHGEVHRLFRLNSAIVAAQYLSEAALNNAYMAVGRSFGYTKSVYQKVSGFSSHLHIPSGDDDLFVQSLPKDTNIHVIPEALTWSDPPETLTQWFRQKMRHNGASAKYTAAVLIRLGIYESSNAVLTLGVVWSLVSYWQPLTYLFLLLALTRYLMLRDVLSRLQRCTSERAYAHKDFLLDSVLSILNPVFSVSTLFKAKGGWRIEV